QPDKGLMGEQLERMSSTVTHQLSKASARGPVVVGKPVDISKQINRLVPALKTAYVDKGIQIELALAETAFVRGDESDFLEIFGNLLENAFKYTATEVAVCLNVVELESGGAAIEVFVEDNGRGIPLERRKEVLNRGKRLDEIEPGQGIGLAVVADLVELYGGRLTISDSDLGGARIRVQLPY
ncbi:MAG: two-component system sensor histidine kinase PhoQ, partial [Limisphaerales bacterium]